MVDKWLEASWQEQVETSRGKVTERAYGDVWGVSGSAHLGENHP